MAEAAEEVGGAAEMAAGVRGASAVAATVWVVGAGARALEVEVVRAGWAAGVAVGEAHSPPPS